MSDCHPVETYNYISKEEFIKFATDCRKPLLIKNFDIGPCKEKWTVDYLTEMMGSVAVKVHVSPVTSMSFIKKNFCYKTLPFSEFIKRASSKLNSNWFISNDELYYLRSLGSDKRCREIADIKKQFPNISDDISFPELFNEADFFSSVFRISSEGVQVWTHYDIMDNMLMQVVGEKRVVLFSPSDAGYLYLKGDKSEVLDIDNPDCKLYPNFPKAQRYECILQPGEILFIPALWFHNTIAHSYGISVNVFWKNLPHYLYDKTDVYGNKDLIPASKVMHKFLKKS
jgi:tRNA wybutosine-synthesizing protein 5